MKRRNSVSTQIGPYRLWSSSWDMEKTYLCEVANSRAQAPGSSAKGSCPAALKLKPPSASLGHVPSIWRSTTCTPGVLLQPPFYFGTSIIFGYLLFGHLPSSSVFAAKTKAGQNQDRQSQVVAGKTKTAPPTPPPFWNLNLLQPPFWAKPKPLALNTRPTLTSA